MNRLSPVAAGVLACGAVLRGRIDKPSGGSGRDALAPDNAAAALVPMPW